MDPKLNSDLSLNVIFMFLQCEAEHIGLVYGLSPTIFGTIVEPQKHTEKILKHPILELWNYCLETLLNFEIIVGAILKFNFFLQIPHFWTLRALLVPLNLKRIVGNELFEM